MEIIRIKYKKGLLEEEEKDKEDYFLKIGPNKFLKLRIFTGTIIEGFGEIISIKSVSFDHKGKMILEETTL